MTGSGIRAMLTASAMSAALWATAAAAQDPAPGPDRSSPDQVSVDQVEAAFEPAATLGDDDLGSVAGRADTGTQIARADQRNTVSNNSVTGNSTTGDVRIDGSAFQNLQGLAVINANSGNNVAINAAMNVTIHLGGPQ